jgi:hypothetical protein
VLNLLGEPLSPRAKWVMALQAEITFAVGFGIAAGISGHDGTSRLLPLVVSAIYMVSRPSNAQPFEKAWSRAVVFLLIFFLLVPLLERDSRLKMTPVDHILNVIGYVTFLAILYTSVKIGNLAAADKSQVQQGSP